MARAENPSTDGAASGPSPRPRWATLLGLTAFALVVAGLVALLVLAPGARVAVGRGVAGDHLAWATPSPTLGAMVTMVGPLGVTFPCWAARHLSRRPRVRADDASADLR